MDTTKRRTLIVPLGVDYVKEDTMSIYVVLEYKQYCDKLGIMGTWEGLYEFRKMWRE